MPLRVLALAGMPEFDNHELVAFFTDEKPGL